VTPTQARQVLAVAHHRSFSKAARALGGSQAAVSNAIAATEALFGVTLFQRTTRAVTPTPAFRALKPQLERLVRAEDAIDSTLERVRGELSRVVKVAISPVVDSRVVDSLIASFERENATTTVRLSELNLKDLEQALSRGEVDVGIAPLAGRSPFKSFVLYSDPLMVVGGPAGAGPLPLQALRGAPIILMPDACGLTRATLKLFRAGGLRLIRSSTTPLGYPLLERGALQGRGVAILPRSKLGEGTPARSLEGALLEVRVLQRRSASGASSGRLLTLLRAGRV
jgi:DNA-binding transcriptional LysR family regulator